MKILGRVLACLLCLLILTSCAQESHPITTMNIVGNWEHKEGSYISTLTMSADGTFTLDHVPLKVVSPVYGPGHELDWSNTLDVVGSWVIGDAAGDQPNLRFDIESVGNYKGFSTNMYVEGSGSTRRLFLPVGPGDDNVNFVFVRTP